MKLAEAIQSASQDDVQTLADYIVKEFDVAERATLNADPIPATGASVASALAAWAYMKLNAQDQGD